MDIIQKITDISVIILVFCTPIAIFIDLVRNIIKNKFILVCMTLLWSAFVFVGLSIYQNMMPTVIVIICIVLLKKVQFKSKKFYDDYDRYKFNINSIDPIQVLKNFVCTLVIMLVCNTLNFYLMRILKFPVKEQEITMFMRSLDLKSFLLMGPMTLIFAPILEEFVFRWFFFRKIFKRMNLYLAAVLSSALFSLVHFNIAGFMIIFAVGIINCYIIYKKGYWFAVLNHTLFNSISYIFMLTQKIN